jgi:hypothetical protein
MNDMIFLKLAGYNGVVPARQFIDALYIFLGLLRDLDATIASDTRGTLEWEMGVISKQSPARVGYLGRSRYRGENFFPRVTDECVRGMRTLANRPERSPSYSDSALYKAERLAKLTKRAFAEIDIELGQEEVPVTLRVAENVEILTKQIEEEEGSVVGNLDAISVHRGNEFRVWDENTKKAVRCFFPEGLLEKAKNSLKRRVMVVGKTRINKLGNVVSVEVSDIEAYPTDAELPTVEQMSGSIKNLTGDLSLRDYMKMLREDH